MLTGSKETGRAEGNLEMSTPAHAEKIHVSRTAGSQMRPKGSLTRVQRAREDRAAEVPGSPGERCPPEAQTSLHPK